MVSKNPPEDVGTALTNFMARLTSCPKRTHHGTPFVS